MNDAITLRPSASPALVLARRHARKRAFGNSSPISGTPTRGAPIAARSTNSSPDASSAGWLRSSRFIKHFYGIAKGEFRCKTNATNAWRELFAELKQRVSALQQIDESGDRDDPFRAQLEGETSKLLFELKRLWKAYYVAQATGDGAALE